MRIHRFAASLVFVLGCESDSPASRDPGGDSTPDAAPDVAETTGSNTDTEAPDLDGGADSNDSNDSTLEPDGVADSSDTPVGPDVTPDTTSDIGFDTADTVEDIALDVAETVVCACEHGECAPGTSTCSTCDPGRFGPSCAGVCPAPDPEQCLRGTCSSGPEGDGSCLCEEGIIGSRCDQCVPELIKCGGEEDWTCVEPHQSTWGVTIAPSATVIASGRLTQTYVDAPNGNWNYVERIDVWLPANMGTVKATVLRSPGNRFSAPTSFESSPVTVVDAGLYTFAFEPGGVHPFDNRMDFSLEFSGAHAIPVIPNAYDGNLNYRRINGGSVDDPSNDLHFVVHLRRCP